MGKCYGSPFMQYTAGLVIVVGMPLYTAAIGLLNWNNGVGEEEDGS